MSGCAWPSAWRPAFAMSASGGRSCTHFENAAGPKVLYRMGEVLADAVLDRLAEPRQTMYWRRSCAEALPPPIAPGRKW